MPLVKFLAQQLKKIAEEKLPDLNTSNIDQAAKIMQVRQNQWGLKLQIKATIWGKEEKDIRVQRYYKK